MHKPHSLFSGTHDPDEARLTVLHRRLLLWYSCLVAGLILFFGLLIAISMPQWLTFTLRSELSSQTEKLAQRWSSTPGHPCPQLNKATHYLLACFDAQGHLLALHGEQGNPLTAQFTANTLALAAIRERAGVDDAFDSTGSNRIETQTFFITRNPALFRYARPVHDGQALLGILQLGILPGGAAGQKELLINYILLAVATAELSSPLAGWFLANRAIRPTRLAFKRQKEFIANASHELRTPLALLRTNAEVLLRGKEHLPPEDVELLEDIVAEAVHMNLLTNHMLLLARMDTGQQHLEQEVIDLAELAKLVGRRATSLATERGITLHIETTTACILGDRVLLEQLLLILLDNALKYNHPEGTITITSGSTRQHVFLAVRDSGIGIPPEHLPRLGERFYRVDKARSREQGGNGLGLSIAQNIASLHKGTLTFQSSPGTGTTVTLLLSPASRPTR